MNSKNKINFKFFSKNCGFSKGIYKSLNCGKFSKDNPELIKKNIDYAKNKMNLLNRVLVIPRQSHSNNCLIINKESDNKGNADALVTNSSNLILGITTADCIPLIFFDNENYNIGICHAGWKGLSNGIIEKTIEKMILIGSSVNSINVVIGPCIRKYSYEINYDFLHNFKLPKTNPYSSLRENRLYFNLPKFATNILQNQDIRSIKDYKKNTYLDVNYFSYRQSKHRKYSDYGRNLSLVAIK